MKNSSFLILLLLCPVLSFGQIGIGTTSPHEKSILDLTSTTKGLLIPRMTAVQRLAMGLTAADRGMMVFQTDIPVSPPFHPVGMYTFDGTGWVAPVPNASTVGYTLRWDGTKWGATSNLFNQGSSIGIGTTSPKSQLHVHSTSAPVAKIQITNPSSITPNSTPATRDGLIIGMGPSGEAFFTQQEAKPILFATDSIERLRVDATGNVGIGRNNPSAKLDVNGTVQLGTNGLTVDSDGNVGINDSDPGVSLDVNGTVQLGTNGLSVDSDGNVGIHQSDPAVSLDVNGTVKLGSNGLSVDSDGNVGIHEPDPSVSLDVNGTVQLGTNGISVDSDGNVGINESDPSAILDVNGTIKLGQNRTPITGILRNSIPMDIPLLLGGQGLPCLLSFPNANLGATVFVSPSLPLADIAISYAMVALPGTIEIKFVNMSALPIDLASITLHITVIQ